MAFDLEPAGHLAPAAEPASSVPDSHVPDEPSVDRSAPPDLNIYATGSDGVSPPIGIRPQLPRELPSTIRSEDLGQIELIVAADGSVESVKLVGGQHRSVHDAMFLSVAKAWRFQPAMKNGVPVRYRKTIWIAPQ